MYPFTPDQWQELEHQALIFKYMASGIPVPPDLLFFIKRGCLDSPFSPKLFPYQASPMGWGCFQMGPGRKIDAEPGRCRRTDGKKWRCSKEAYPDSKYCERHMHRGKNRSRKPVEHGGASLSSSSSVTSLSLFAPELQGANYHYLSRKRTPQGGDVLKRPFLISEESGSSRNDAWQLSMASSCSSKQVKEEEEKTVHRFFDEWPPKSKYG